MTDGQTNNAPFVTRTEAHERVVSQSRPVRLDIDKLKIHASNTYDKRTWLVPYMGDASHMAVAGLKHFGIDGKVLPTNTPRGYEVARKHVSTEVCYPLKGVVGDAIGFLQEQIEQTSRQAVEDKYLVMVPTTSGPCRFGKYSEVVRHFMKLEGLEKIPVVGPSSETDYIDIPLPGGLGVIRQGQDAADPVQRDQCGRPAGGHPAAVPAVRGGQARDGRPQGGPARRARTDRHRRRRDRASCCNGDARPSRCSRRPSSAGRSGSR